MEDLIEKMEKHVLRSEALKDEQLQVIEKHGRNRFPQVLKPIVIVSGKLTGQLRRIGG